MKSLRSSLQLGTRDICLGGENFLTESQPFQCQGQGEYIKEISKNKKLSDASLMFVNILNTYSFSTLGTI